MKIHNNQWILKIILFFIISIGMIDSILNILVPNIVRILLCCVCFAVLLIFSINWGKIKFYNFDILLLLIILFFCINNRAIKTFNSFYFLRYFLLFLLLFISRNIKHFPNYVFKIFIPLCLIHIFSTLWLSVDSWTYTNIIVNFFGEERKEVLLDHYNRGWIPGLANHYSSNGMYLSVSTIIFSVLFFNSSSKNKTFQLILFILSIIALLLTGKRAHFIFSIFSIFVIYYFSSKIKRGKMIYIICSLFICVLVTLLGYTLVPRLFSFIDRFKDTISSGDVTMGRIDTWKVAYSVFRNNAFFGIGWNEFSSIAPFYNVTINVHNVYLQLLCEVGIFGAIAYFHYLYGHYF